MSWLAAVLFVLAFVSGLAYLGLHFWAYQEIRDKKSWGQQARGLDDWWVFDKDLLPPEHDHLRIAAGYCLCVATGSSVALWLLLR